MTVWGKRTRGFTLIEMAIVMVVIGLVLSGGLVAVAPVLQNSKVAQTEQRLDRIEQALILHVIRYGCLPCPADGGLANTNTNAGAADTTGGTYYTSGCSSSTCTNTVGVVPWVNLGLSEADITDGFDNRIDYAATNALVVTNGMTRTPPSSYPAGALTVSITNSGNNVTTAAAYVLVSHGVDKFGGYRAQVGGSRITGGVGSSSTDQIANKDGDTTFVQKDAIYINGSTYFDDEVRWRTAPMIIQLCGTNACGNPA